MTTEYSAPSSYLPLSYKIVTLRNNETLQGHSFASLDPDEGRIKRRWPDAHGLLGRRQFIVCLSSFYSAREGTRRPSCARVLEISPFALCENLESTPDNSNPRYLALSYSYRESTVIIVLARAKRAAPVYIF